MKHDDDLQQLLSLQQLGLDEIQYSSCLPTIVKKQGNQQSCVKSFSRISNKNPVSHNANNSTFKISPQPPLNTALRS